MFCFDTDETGCTEAKWCPVLLTSVDALSWRLLHRAGLWKRPQRKSVARREGLDNVNVQSRKTNAALT